jgi:dihydrofolate synthase/folylpolyglutamate synthase
VDNQTIRRGLQGFNLAGRFQIFPDKAQLILDVAHNCQSAALLARNLKALPLQGKTHVLIGMLKDKDHHAIFREISEVADFWHIVTLDNPRGADCHLLSKELVRMGLNRNISCYNSVADALNSIREIVAPQDRIVITGSFLTVGAAIIHLKFQH